MENIFKMLEDLQSNCKESLGFDLNRNAKNFIDGSNYSSWRFAQKCLVGEEPVTCVEFNYDGDLLAVGSQDGHIVVYKHLPVPMRNTPVAYKQYSYFRSHSSKFDYLHSLEIEEKINRIRWLNLKNAANFLLSTNDTTIKLWRLMEQNKTFEGFNTVDEAGLRKDPQNITTLRLPYVKRIPSIVEPSERRIFNNAHDFQINSISLNSDQATFLSADDLRINLWHLDNAIKSFNIVDIKPSDLNQLAEVITSAGFHPIECNVFAYSSSGGKVRLCDMRSSALCDRHSKQFVIKENLSAFLQGAGINPIADVKISPNGQYMLSRSFKNLNIWDLKMEKKPVETYQVHDYLSEKILPLHNYQNVFDKFECCWSGNGNSIMTGCYNNFFKVVDLKTKSDLTLRADRNCRRPKTVGFVDFEQIIRHIAWHPKEKIIAIASHNNLFIYKGNTFQENFSF